MKNKKKAFSLAETLIAIALIGVITVVSIIVFQQVTFKDRMAEGLKATYNKFSQAMMIMIQNNRGSLTGLFTDDQADISHADSMLNEFCNNMKCVRTCSYTEPLGNCWSSGWAWYGFDGSALHWGGRSSAILADGTLVFFENRSNNCSSTFVTTFPVCGALTVDLNGHNGPNKIGRDIFRFYIGPKSLIPFGVSGDSDSITYSSRGQQYAFKVISEGAMNY